ncbi:hypothetical protein GGR57DRAFT_481604 [Xylariaceae sp. FL1272]|nr:hypothetical protein GGR57DRAFT_481604 [Xylariaceae sp. FL1272]
MSRSLLRSALSLRAPVCRAPAFALPIQTQASRALSTAPQQVDATPQQYITKSTVTPTPLSASQTSNPATPTPVSTTESLSLLPLLRAQPAHYITIHIHGKPYLVTPGDSIRLPFLMHGVLPGDVLRLDKASVLGSRDYTLKGSPYIDSNIFECRAIVLGVESEPLRVKIKTKRRNRRSQRVTSKHKYTILRISELKINEG